MRVLIFEPSPSGHRFSTVRGLVEAMADLPVQISLLTGRDAFDTPQYREQIGPVSQSIDDTIAIDAVPAEGLRGALHKARALAATLTDAHRFDHVYVPYGDGTVQLLPLVAPGLPRTLKAHGTVLEALLMRGDYVYLPGKRLQRLLAHIGVRSAGFERLHFSDPVVRQYFARQSEALSSRCRAIPDPTIARPVGARDEARRALGLPAHGTIVGSIGVMDTRKGIDLLIDAFLRVRRPGTDYLLLGGKLNRDIQQHLQDNTDDSVLTADRYLSEREFDDALSALDLVVAGYPRFYGPASLCIRAAGAGKPVLATNTGWMANVVERFDLGMTCDVTDPGAYDDALRQMINRCQAFEPSTESVRFARYFQTANLNAHWTALLRERLGLALPDMSEWPA